jgi:hypothetical protein
MACAAMRGHIFGRKLKPMSLSLYESSVPVYERALNAFLAILDKAEEHAQARKSIRTAISLCG